MEETIRIGSRASRLAVIQSELVMAEIRRIQPAVKLELVTMKTTGDKILNKTLDKIGERDFSKGTGCRTSGKTGGHLCP